MELAELLATPDLADLGPGPRPGRQSIADLDRSLETIFKAGKLAQQKQELIRALTYLWHDHLDESHSLAQNIPTADGSYVHGIMHRREPDYGNAKYWFHRVGVHAAFERLAQAANGLHATDSERALLNRMVGGGQWDAFAFIDACQEEARSGKGHAAFLRRVQQTEFLALLAHFSGEGQA